MQGTGGTDPGKRSGKQCSCPRIAPGLMAQVQAPYRVFYHIGYHFTGRVFLKQGLYVFDPVLFLAVWVGKCPAAQTQWGKDRTVDHSRGYLIMIFAALKDRRRHLSRRRGNEINCVSMPFKQMVAAWVELGRLFFLYFINNRASMSFSSLACKP